MNQDRCKTEETTINGPFEKVTVDQKTDYFNA